jgi:hypothetical protein
MKILFIAVFDELNKSTNNSQARGLEHSGAEVIKYNFRVRADELGSREKRDLEIIEVCKTELPDLVIFSKGNLVNIRVIHECNKYSKTCLWFMDATPNWDAEARTKALYCSFVCCDKPQVYQDAYRLNKNTFLVPEGFDQDIDRPRHCTEQDIDVSFIGSIYGYRADLINSVTTKIQVFQNAFAKEHANVVSRSKINLNMCTANCMSDRVYKILAAGGFLLTNDWLGRSDIFIDKEHLVIFDSISDLNEKIQYYLKDTDERNRIRYNGFIGVQKYSRNNWAKKIIEISKSIT